MTKLFINLQLFGDAPADPTTTTTDPTGPVKTPGDTGGDTQPNDAEMLLEFRKKHVPIEDYLREKTRADGYLQAILENREGEIAEAEGGSTPRVNPDEIAEKLFVHDNNMTDLEYITNVLDLRRARMAAGEPDPFLPSDYDDNDVEIAENVADVFEQCVKLANGDNASFIGILQGRIKENSVIPKLPRNNQRR